MSRFLDRRGVINTNHEEAWQGFVKLCVWCYFDKEIKREGDYHNSRLDWMFGWDSFINWSSMKKTAV